MGRMLNSELGRLPEGRTASPAGRTTSAARPLRGTNTNAVARSAGASPAGAHLSPVSASAVGDEELSGFRLLAFRAGLAMLFIRLTALPELLVALIHANTYLLWIVGPPAIIGAMMTGALQRTFAHRAASMWLGFLVCLVISIPLSTWPGASVQGVRLYGFISFPLVFVVGGLATKWDDLRAIFTTMGVSGVFLIAAASFMAKPDSEGRLNMTDSSLTIGNSNDLASLLILLIPFVLYVATDKSKPALLRWPLIVPVALAFKMILGTASRGALVAIFGGILLVLFRGSGRQKLALVVAIGAMVSAAPFVVNSNSLERLATLGGGDVDPNSVGDEARQSKEERRYVLEQSLIATLKNPVLGVGMGQFSNYVGQLGKESGKSGAALHWAETHNAFTQVSSECGTPALIFFVLGIGSALGSVNKIYGRARREGHTQVANTCFFYLASMVPYLISIVFLANAYRLYLPAMIGLAVAITTAAQHELDGGRVILPNRNGNVGPGMVRRQSLPA